MKRLIPILGTVSFLFLGCAKSADQTKIASGFSLQKGHLSLSVAPKANATAAEMDTLKAKMSLALEVLEK